MNTTYRKWLEGVWVCGYPRDITMHDMTRGIKVRMTYAEGNQARAPVKLHEMAVVDTVDMIIARLMAV